MDCMHRVGVPVRFLSMRTPLLQAPLLYLKPVQTGFPTDSDARLVVLPSPLRLMTPDAAPRSAPAVPCIICLLRHPYNAYMHLISCMQQSRGLLYRV